MTIEARHIELMNAEIDGANSERESQELREILSRSAEAREQFAGLKRLSEQLARVEFVEAPDDLGRNVLQAVRSLGPRPGRAGFVRNILPPRPLAIRYAYSFAAGVIVAVVGLGIATGGFHSGLGDHRALSGTIGAWEGAAAVTVPLEFAGVAGTARVSRRGQVSAVEVDLASGGPAELALDYDPLEMGLRGFNNDGGNITSLSSGRVVWTQRAGQRVRLLVAMPSPGDVVGVPALPVVTLHCSVKGAPAGQATLHLEQN